MGTGKKVTTSHTNREEDFTDTINQPYGPNRDSQGNRINPGLGDSEGVGRNNSTAKGQKRQESKNNTGWRKQFAHTPLKTEALSGK